MAAIATVQILNEAGDDYIIINETDFDPKQHQRWKAKSKAKASLADDPGSVEAKIAARILTLQDENTIPELKAIAEKMSLEIKSRAKQAEIAEAIARAELG